MQCPACHRALSSLTVGDVTVDVCQDGCAGMWFDHGELISFDDPSDALGQTLVALAGDPRAAVDVTVRRRCPRCPSSVLMRHFFSAKRAVTVDECPTCGGMWLDAGELAQVRAEYTSRAARRQAAIQQGETTLAVDRLALVDEQIQRQLPYDTSRSRITSSVVVIAYLIVASRFGASATVRIVQVCILPLACVWFPDAMGAMVGWRITRPSHRWFVWCFGWVVLLLPLLITAIVLVQTIH